MKLKKRLRAQLKKSLRSSHRKVLFLLSIITSSSGTPCLIITFLSPSKSFNPVYDFYILTILTINFPRPLDNRIVLRDCFHNDGSLKMHRYLA